MKNYTKFFLAIVCSYFLTPINSYSQENSGISLGKGFSVMPSLNYVSSATIMLNPFSGDLIEKGVSEELKGGYGYGITIKKKFFREDLSFGLTAEYLKIKDDELSQIFNSGSERVKVRITEELVIVPVEFTGYFNIPDFSEDLKIYLGGGVGVYFGDRKRTIGNIQTKTISKQAGFSFVILSGIEYYFSRQISGVFEMRFRQGEYKVRSEFPVSGLEINGSRFPLEKNLNSKIFIDGLKLSFGLAYNF